MAVASRQLSGFRVYCDESNTDGRKRHPIYGAILVALDDTREVQQELAHWRRREVMHGELKWEKVRGVPRGGSSESEAYRVNPLRTSYDLALWEVVRPANDYGRGTTD